MSRKAQNFEYTRARICVGTRQFTTLKDMKYVFVCFESLKDAWYIHFALSLESLVFWHLSLHACFAGLFDYESRTSCSDLKELAWCSRSRAFYIT